MINKEKVINAIAEKYGIIITPDDPIITTILINDEVLEQYLGAINESLDKALNDIEDKNKQYNDNSKKLAQEIIGNTVNNSKTAIDHHVVDRQTQLKKNLETLIERNSTICKKTHTYFKYFAIFSISTILSIFILILFLYIYFT